MLKYVVRNRFLLGRTLETKEIKKKYGLESDKFIALSLGFMDTGKCKAEDEFRILKAYYKNNKREIDAIEKKFGDNIGSLLKKFSIVYYPKELLLMPNYRIIQMLAQYLKSLDKFIASSRSKRLTVYEYLIGEIQSYDSLDELFNGSKIIEVVKSVLPVYGGKYKGQEIFGSKIYCPEKIEIDDELVKNLICYLKYGYPLSRETVEIFLSYYEVNKTVDVVDDDTIFRVAMCVSLATNIPYAVLFNQYRFLDDSKSYNYGFIAVPYGDDFYRLVEPIQGIFSQEEIEQAYRKGFSN